MNDNKTLLVQFTHLVYANILKFTFFIYSESEEIKMNVPSARFCQHTHSFKHTHTTTHTGSDRGRRLPSGTLLFYFGRVDKKACPCPNMVNGAVERSGSAANHLGARHRRSSVWRTHGIPLTQEPRGACVAKNKPQRQQRSRGAITG